MTRILRKTYSKFVANYPKAIQEAIDAFARLPSIGPKTAERLVFYLLRRGDSTIVQFISTLTTLHKQVNECSVCFNFCLGATCEICSNAQRTKEVVCVVAYPQDVQAMEKTAAFHGRYHVLGGTLDTLDGVTPDQLTIRKLLERISSDGITELILALNPDTTGETTMLYLTSLFKELPNVTITRLGRGLPIGGDVEYADEVTLTNALKQRQKI